jgi:hypothetical protein
VCDWRLAQADAAMPSALKGQWSIIAGTKFL